jgi:hypothetical protein
MKQKKVSPTRVEVREPEKRYGGEYYPLPLPGEVEVLGINEGDTVVLELVEEEIQDKVIHYIRGYSGEAPRNEMTVRRQPGCSPELFVQCPAAFSGEHGSPPFNQLGKGDRLVVEVVVEDDEFRIYGHDDYRYRYQQLSEEDGPPPELPASIPLIASNTGEYTVLSGDVEGQRFKIFPFHGQSDLFVEIAEKEKRESGFSDLKFSMPVGDDNLRSTFYGSRDLLSHVLENYDMPVVEADKVEIFWRDETGEGSVEEKGRIYEEQNTECVKVVLPERGSFLISVEKGGESTLLKLMSGCESGRGTFRDGWSAKLFHDSGECDVPELYVPVPESGKGWWDTSRQQNTGFYLPD